jgi:two-component system nitrate/nitrite sensor histidine kinase NarX
MIDSARSQRAQIGIIVFGSLIPWIADIIFQIRLYPIPGLDFAPYVFWVTGVLTAWSLFHFRFLGITPIARELIIENLRDGMMVIDRQNHIVYLNPAMEELIQRPAAKIIGQNMEQAFAHRLDLLDRFKGVTDQITELTVERDGVRFDYELHVSGIANSQGQSIGRLVVLHNITDRRQGIAELERYAEQNAQLLAEELQQRQLAESLRQTMIIISSSLDRDEIISEILAQLKKVLPYYSAALYLFDGDDLKIERVVGPDSISLKSYTTPRRDSQVAKIFKLKKAEVFLSAFSEETLQPNEPVYSSMAAPLVVGQEAMGVLTIDRYEAQPFTQENAEILQAFTNQAAIAFKNAEYFEHAKAVATIQYSNRLAQDLHDAVNQTLFTVSIMAEALPQVWDRDPEQGRKGLAEIQLLTRGAQAEMRTLLMELRPQSVTEKALGDVLDHLSRAVTSRTRIPIELDIQNDTILPPDVQITFYRIAQETFNNISKHAQASHVEVCLDAQPDRATLSIIDNGLGFDFDQIPSGHLGLEIMAERADLINANLIVDSSPNQGTEVTVKWEAEEGENE